MRGIKRNLEKQIISLKIQAKKMCIDFSFKCKYHLNSNIASDTLPTYVAQPMMYGVCMYANWAAEWSAGTVNLCGIFQSNFSI